MSDAQANARNCTPSRGSSRIVADDQTRQRVRDLFDRAIRLPVETRLSWLRSAAHDEPPRIIEEVISLLASNEDAGEFLGEPESTDDSLRDPPGTRIGRFVLERHIGEGGFGDVYLAEQVEPVRRQVALKVVKPGMDSRELLGRFRAEQHALALLDHRHIARLIDGGATPAGRMYFVMELVEGARITHWCDHRRLAIRERIELFLQVCQAVQHAHQRGVIHRDLKPANVLVTDVDSQPVVKVIDFGVAKILRGEGQEEPTLLTRQPRSLGTPAYMSPEQLCGGAVDTRTDVYSLGVLLHELLSGRLPFDGRARDDPEVDPPPMSQQLNDGAGAGAAATARSTTPVLMRRVLRGELDWIVARCLAPRRDARYATVDALANDLRSYLAGAPVQAAPPARWYHARKFVARHRAIVAGTAALVIVLLGVAIGMTQLALRARRAERLSEERSAELRRVALTFMFDIDQKLQPVLGTLPARIALLDAARRHLDQLAQQSAEDPKLLAEVGAAYQRLAGALNSIGQKSDASEASARAVILLRRLYDAQPQDVSHLLALADAIANRSTTMRDLGRTQQQLDDCREGIVLLERALEAREPVIEPSQATELRVATVVLLGQLAATYRVTGEHEAAMEALRRAISCIDQVDPEHRRLAQVRYNKSIMLQKLGEEYESHGARDQAIASYQAALELLLADDTDQSQRAKFDMAIARNYARLGHIMFLENRTDEAVAYHRRQFEVRQRIAQAESASTVTQRELARSMRQLGLALCRLRRGPDVAEGQRLLDDSVALLHKLVEQAGDDLTLFEELAESYLARGRAHKQEDERDLAVADFLQSIEVNRHVLSVEPGEAIAQSQIKDAREMVAELRAEPARGRR